MRLPPRRRLLALAGLAALVVVPFAMRGASRREARQERPGGAAETSADVAAVAPAVCAGAALQPENAAFEERIVELVNAQRRAAGLSPLKRVEPLTSSARWFAHDMASNDYFAEDHDTYRREGNRLVRACDWGARLGWFYPGWTALAENIAAGYETPEKVVAVWLGSPSHRAKMLGQGQWETGAGYWAGGSAGHYWVQDFGRRTASRSAAEGGLAAPAAGHGLVECPAGSGAGLRGGSRNP
jgi:uncharacterized protein YkwD